MAVGTTIIPVGDVKECQKCGGTIAFLTSKKTGKAYKVDVPLGGGEVANNAFHNCGATMTAAPGNGAIPYTPPAPGPAAQAVANGAAPIPTAVDTTSVETHVGGGFTIHFEGVPVEFGGISPRLTQDAALRLAHQLLGAALA